MNDHYNLSISKVRNAAMRRTFLFWVFAGLVSIAVQIAFVMNAIRLDTLHSYNVELITLANIGAACLLLPIFLAYGYWGKKMHRRYIDEAIEQVSHFIVRYESSMLNTHVMFADLENTFTHSMLIVREKYALESDEQKAAHIREIAAALEEKMARFNEKKAALYGNIGIGIEAGLEQTLESMYNSILDSISKFNELKHLTLEELQKSETEYLAWLAVSKAGSMETFIKMKEHSKNNIATMHELIATHNL
ncbi:MAG: hypothetical protein V4478_03030 [Patescibacteria group bacterium]